MKYIKKYPDAEYLAEVEPGLIKVKKEEECWNCHEKGTFVDIDFLAYLCSDECRNQKWEEYWKAFHMS